MTDSIASSGLGFRGVLVAYVSSEAIPDEVLDGVISDLFTALSAHCMVEGLVKSIGSALKSLSSHRKHCVMNSYRSFHDAHPHHTVSEVCK
jgi:hypothetical protein